MALKIPPTNLRNCDQEIVEFTACLSFVNPLFLQIDFFSLSLKICRQYLRLGVHHAGALGLSEGVRGSPGHIVSL